VIISGIRSYVSLDAVVDIINLVMANVQVYEPLFQLVKVKQQHWHQHYQRSEQSGVLAAVASVRGPANDSSIRIRAESKLPDITSPFASVLELSVDINNPSLMFLQDCCRLDSRAVCVQFEKIGLSALMKMTERDANGATALNAIVSGFQVSVLSSLDDADPFLVFQPVSATLHMSTEIRDLETREVDVSFQLPDEVIGRISFTDIALVQVS